MQIKDHLMLLREAISGQRALSYVAKISSYNRVQLSGGYDTAAEYCADQMRKNAVDCSVMKISLERGSQLWSQKGFDGWTCTKGILQLQTPEKRLLCDYQTDPMSMIQRSGECQADNVPIIMLDRGHLAEAYSNIVFDGKMVFVPDAPYSQYLWAVKEKGALGLITDYIPETYTKNRETAGDSRSFFSFYWDEDETPFCGFVLSPKQGEWLKAQCRKAEEQGRDAPTCRIRIEADSFPGSAHIVNAFIPGESEGEIVITAHLCHARACSNDNASGCAGAMEALSVLSRLIQEEQLPRPKFGLRMLLVPEVSGTFAYLATQERQLKNIKAAINLDMIGRRQEGRSGLLGIWATPDSLPSFLIDLMAYIRRLSNCEAPSFNIDGHVTPFHSQIMEYNGGSDHYVYCDPTVGIPCITFMQWMDKDYHTDHDICANLDSEMLHKSIEMAACWAFAAAAPDLTDLSAAFLMMQERFIKMLHTGADQKNTQMMGLARFCRYETEVFGKASEDALRIYGEAAREMVKRQKKALQILAELSCADDTAPEPRLNDAGDERIPVRIIKGPLSFVGSALGARADAEIAHLDSQFPALYGYHSVNFFILSRVDGKHTVSEIAVMVGLESRFYSLEYVGRYLDILDRYGVIHYLDTP